MTLRYMLDSSFCIRLLRKKPVGLHERFHQNAEALCISTIVLHELLFGVEKSSMPAHNRSEVDKLTARVAVLAFDSEAAAHSAQIRASLQRVGLPIGDADALIAGHARSRGLVVVTGNLREFARVEGLRCEDW